MRIAALELRPGPRSGPGHLSPVAAATRAGTMGSAYLGIRIFLRFQYKLSIILLLLGRRRVDFSLMNELLIYGIHVTMLLVGGLGWCFMVFVDM
ncbi:hypothetical protein KIL84_021866 [Mauremys mutica]|uniref:Uncharacterized protein n=1 Tax=Mauremys mutica TaxID=74926 RepID=A0A9D3XG62_9SAUR|nr:hypothetical protein KIL84_021866 [Mauremys mutica]